MGQLTGTAALLGSGALGLSLGIATSEILRWLLNRRRSALTLLSLDSSPETHVEKLRRNPHWEPPQKQPAPFPQDQIITFDPLTMEPGALYPLMISAVVPRPIAFISTLSKDGVGNLSPYSYFNVLSHEPPVLAMGHCWSKGKPKDSLRNILDTREMVVSIISEWFVESANHTCGPYPSSVNEMELSGLTPVPSAHVAPPRVAESAVNFECKLLHHYDLKDKIKVKRPNIRHALLGLSPADVIPLPTFLVVYHTEGGQGVGFRVQGDNYGLKVSNNASIKAIVRCEPFCVRYRAGNTTNTVVLAEIVLIHVAEGVTMKTPNSGKTVVDPVKLQPVCRLGGNTYGAQLQLFDIPRPDKDGRYPGSSSYITSDRNRTIGSK